MFENLFPILGQLVTISMVGALIGGGTAMFAAHLAASHAAVKNVKKARMGQTQTARPRQSAPSRLSMSS